METPCLNPADPESLNHPHGDDAAEVSTGPETDSDQLPNEVTVDLKTSLQPTRLRDERVKCLSPAGLQRRRKAEVPLWTTDRAMDDMVRQGIAATYAVAQGLPPETPINEIREVVAERFNRAKRPQ